MDSHPQTDRPQAERDENEGDRVLIFDTTLRDGEQCPGASMGMEAKLELAAALADLGVDILEAGFPIASEGDFEAVQAIARQIEGPVIAGLARTTRGDIERAWEAICDAARPRLHVFLATSEIHRNHKLKMACSEIVRRTAEEVARARDLCDDVEFSPEDASRTEPDFLAEVVETAIDAGATTVNIPDTTGYAVPGQFADLIRYLKQHVTGIERAVISVHCHNDLGMAVANSLAAVRAGARQVECTINGIGERAGNASLEEVVMALRTRSDFFAIDTRIHGPGLLPASRLLTRFADQAHGPRGAAQQGHRGRQRVRPRGRHPPARHDHARLYLRDHAAGRRGRRPEPVGARQAQRPSRVSTTARRARAHARRRSVRGDLRVVQGAGRQEARDLRCRHRRAARRAGGGRVETAEPHWTLEGFQAVAGSGLQHVASVDLRDPQGVVHREAACGEGPIDSVFKAIQRLTGVTAHLRDYSVKSVSIGKDAQGEAVLEIEYAGKTYRGRAISTDIVDASVRAYVGVINRIATKIVGPTAWQASALVPGKGAGESAETPPSPAKS